MFTRAIPERIRDEQLVIKRYANEVYFTLHRSASPDNERKLLNFRNGMRAHVDIRYEFEIGALTHLRVVNRNQRMLPRFNEKSAVPDQCNIVIIMKIDLQTSEKNKPNLNHLLYKYSIQY